MHVFTLHKEIMQDYRSYIESFINTKGQSIHAKMNEKIESGKLWLKSLIQFNPSFKKDNSIDRLILDNVIDLSLKRIFDVYDLYQYQVEVIKLGVKIKCIVVI